MILVFNLNDIIINNLFFTETRKNITMDGTFSKIIYSDENVAMNGIYLNMCIDDYSYDKSHSKIILKGTKNNIKIINEITELEHYILKYFKHINATTKQTKYLLKEQLNAMLIKVYRYNHQHLNNIELNGKTILRISGIWEDTNNIGLTFKIMEIFPLV